MSCLQFFQIVCAQCYRGASTAGTSCTCSLCISIKDFYSTIFEYLIKNYNVASGVYAEYFTSKPARSCVAVKTLPKNVLVEVEVIAEI